MERKLYETIVKEKDKATISGNKVRFTTSTLLYLSKQMKQNGASLKERMVFEREFLEANGIIVPDSFFSTTPIAEEKNAAYDNVLYFFKYGTAPSEKNLCGSMFYNGYVKFCEKYGIEPIGKQACYEYMKSEGFMKNFATVDGKTLHNVIIHREL